MFPPNSPLAEFFLGCIYPGDSLDCSAPHHVLSTHPPLLLDAAMQTFSHSAASADVSAQLPLAEFLLGCIYPGDSLDCSAPPPALGNASSAALPQPTETATTYSPSSTSRTSDRHEGTTAPRARLQSAPQPPPGLENYAHLCASHGIPVKAAPVRPRLRTSNSVPSLQPHVCTTQVGPHPVR